MRLVSGTLDITPEGKAFIRGVAVDVLNDDRELASAARRMHR